MIDQLDRRDRDLLRSLRAFKCRGHHREPAGIRGKIAEPLRYLSRYARAYITYIPERPPRVGGPPRAAQRAGGRDLAGAFIYERAAARGRYEFRTRARRRGSPALARALNSHALAARNGGVCA